MNKQAMFHLMLLVLCSALLPAQAEDNFSWQGFAAQGLIQAEHSNYVNTDGELSGKLTELGVNGRYSFAPDSHLAGQVVYLNGGNRYAEGARLDYLFWDWALFNGESWQANLYLGRVKNQHWLYSSTRDVPFTRPAIILPQSVYFDGFRDIAVGTDGIAWQARHASLAGDLTLNWSFGTTPVSRQQSRRLLGYGISGSTSTDRDHKFSLYWQPTLSSFSYGMVLLDAAFRYRPGEAEPLTPGNFTVQRVMLNMRYQGEFWEFASEIQQERIKTTGFYVAQFELQQLGQGGYLLAQYHYSPDLRFYGMFDYTVLDKDDRHGHKLEQLTGGVVAARFGYQHTLAAGFSVDLHPQWRLQAEVHYNKGLARLTPVLQPDVVNNTREYWQVFAAQLMYRF